MKSAGIIAVGIIGILLGAGGYWLVGRGPFHAIPSGGPTKSVPNNAPVMVRGGSLIFRSQNLWNQGSSSKIYKTTVSNADLKKLSVDGVTKTQGVRPTITETAGENGALLTNNWYMTLIFRDSGGSTLQICPYVSNNACSASGSLSGETTLYLVGDGNGTFTIDTDHSGNPIQVDGQYLLHYDLNSCSDGSSGEHTKCDHILQVNATLSGVTNWDSGDLIAATTLWCYVGQCNVGIGQ